MSKCCHKARSGYIAIYLKYHAFSFKHKRYSIGTINIILVKVKID